jgi:hypothetical protein
MDDIHEDENDIYQSMNWTLIPDRQVEIRENLAQVAAFILYLLQNLQHGLGCGFKDIVELF